MSSLTNDVVFDPPPASEVEGEIEELINWENNNSEHTHPLLKAGIIHFELVRIHPFADLNGRTARLMATWSLNRDGFDINKYFSLEEYYDQNPKAYYQALDSANDGDLTEWLMYFCQGVADEMDLVKNKVIEISKDRRFKTKVGQVALNDRQIKIISIIEEKSEFINPDFATYFPKLSDDSILRDLNDLIQKKVIIKKGKTKGAKYIMA
jgi:Fic family protein